MSEISDWLRCHGLARYSDLFAEHDIELDVLQDITEEEFERLGISIGDRKRLLRAISTLKQIHTTKTRASSAQVESPSSDAPERRHLTVMFCDLKGSTSLSTNLELEDYRKVLRIYQSACVSVINRYEGVVSRYVGDGIQVFFGHPEAHEDDTERAVRTALGIIEEIGDLNRRNELPDSTSLAVRIGIASGRVIVGDIIGEGASEVNAIVGDTPNLAARLQALAEPDNVLIADTTKKLLGGWFDFEFLGNHNLKGFPEAIPVWRVLGALDSESRFDAMHPSTLSPFVGRDEEYALLRRQWNRCVQGEGHVFVLSGEPGIGKSRMVKEFRESVEDDKSLVLGHQCSPHHINSALYPIIRQLEWSANFEPDDSPENKITKLQHLLTSYGEMKEKSLALFGALLSVPQTGEYRPPEMTPERQKEATFQEIIHRIDSLAQQQPMLVIFEDVHWIDPTTLELLQRYIERSQPQRIMLMVTCRPGFKFSWGHYPHVTYLTLSRLGKSDVNAMIENIAGNIELPVEVMGQITNETDGIALFVEEVTRSVVESGWLGRADQDELSSDVSFMVPSTLQDSLMARLDRLSPYKEIAQIGATIGREFSHDLIMSVSALGAQDLQAALDALVESGIVFRRHALGDTHYRFKHALVQDTAYASILRDKKVFLHAQIADVLAQKLTLVTTEPEIIAHHWTEAQEFEKAVRYWGEAGERAAARSANVEALKNFEYALNTLNELPDTAQRKARELDLLVELGAIQVAVEGYSSPVVEQTYTRALELSKEQTEETPELCFILSGIAAYYCVSGQLRRAEESAKRCLDLANKIGGSEHLVDAHRTLGEIFFYAGDMKKSRFHLEQCLALYDIEQHADVAITSGDDPAASCYMYMAIILWLTGHSKESVEKYELGLELAKKLNHLHTLAAAQFNAAWFHALRREWQRAIPLAEASVALCDEHKFPMFQGLATVLQGWCLAQSGQNEAGISRMQKGMALIQEENAGVCLSCFWPWLAEGLALSGDSRAALNVLRKSFHSSDEHVYDAERLRLKGDLLSIRDADPSEVEECYAQAINFAREREMPALELRTKISLCGYWRDHGKLKDAYCALGEVCQSFENDAETPDLLTARKALGELSTSLGASEW